MKAICRRTDWCRKKGRALGNRTKSRIDPLSGGGGEGAKDRDAWRSIPERTKVGGEGGAKSSHKITRSV